MLLINQSQDFLKKGIVISLLMNSSRKKEARLFNLMKNFKDRKKHRKKKKNLLSFQGPSPLVCPIIVVVSTTTTNHHSLEDAGKWASPLFCPPNIFTRILFQF
jgi:hypothetical protein